MELFGTKSTKQKSPRKKYNKNESITNNTSKIFEHSSLPKNDGTKNGTKKGQKVLSKKHKINLMKITLTTKICVLQILKNNGDWR